jgi:peptidyl-prolyl cis-trans isomerase C
MISVNGVAIDNEAVAREMQHHPAPSREEAERAAATALVVRELLLQRVKDREIAGADEDERIANLMDLEVKVPEPTLQECERYYRRNTLRFMSAPLYEAAHVFFPARQDDEETAVTARSVCAAAVQQPQRFADLAKLHSSCSSKDSGGSLGQITKGDTNPELERAMARMNEGSIELVRSRHGFHVLRLDRRVTGKQLSFEQVQAWIADHLRTASKRRATAQYLQLLSAGANIEGVDLAAADSPLVQ